MSRWFKLDPAGSGTTNGLPHADTKRFRPQCTAGNVLNSSSCYHLKGGVAISSSIIAKCTDEGIERSVEVIGQGGVIVFPTDTVYGVGCNPYNEEAVARVFKLKQRDERKPLPVLVGSIADAEALVDLGRDGKLLANAYWPGPVTLVAPLRDTTISKKITSGGGKLGVRIPANKCALALLARCRRLVGTSANLSAGESAKSAGEVLRSGLAGFDLLLDGGTVDIGRESTIVDVTNRIIVREGAIRSQEIFRMLGVG